MKPVSQTVAGVGTSAPIPLDHFINPFTLGLSVSLSATATYSVQGTLDDIRAPGWSAATANWFSLPNFNALSAAAQGLVQFPVTAIRLNVTASTGNVTLRSCQAGPGV